MLLQNHLRLLIPEEPSNLHHRRQRHIQKPPNRQLKARKNKCYLLRRLLLRAAPLSAVGLGVPPAAIPRAIPAAHPLPPCPQVLDGVLKEIATALLQADVNVRLVANLR